MTNINTETSYMDNIKNTLRKVEPLTLIEVTAVYITEYDNDCYLDDKEGYPDDLMDINFVGYFIDVCYDADQLHDMVRMARGYDSKNEVLTGVIAIPLSVINKVDTLLPSKMM